MNIKYGDTVSSTIASFSVPARGTVTKKLSYLLLNQVVHSSISLRFYCSTHLGSNAYVSTCKV